MSNNSIDSLSIQIGANVNSATRQLDTLDTHLSNLQRKLGNFKLKNLESVTNSVKGFSNAMSSLSASATTTDLNKIVSQLTKLQKLDGNKIGNIGTKLNTLAGGMQTLGNVQYNNQGMQNLINSITRLSNSNINNVSTDSFDRLGNGIVRLSNRLSNAKTVSSNTISMTNAIAKLSNAGDKATVVATTLPTMSTALNNFMNVMSKSANVSESVINFTNALGTLANAGNKASATASSLAYLGEELAKVIQRLAQLPEVSNSVTALVTAISQLANAGGVSKAFGGLTTNTTSTISLFKRLKTIVTNVASRLNVFSLRTKSASANVSTLASNIGLLYAKFFLLFRAIKWIANAVESTGDYIEAFNFFDVAINSDITENGNWEELGYENAKAYVDAFKTELTDLNAKMSGFQQDIESGDYTLDLSMANLGINLTDLVQFESEIISLGSSMGLTTEATRDMAKGLTMLTADMSSLHNIDLDTVMQNFESGLIGQSRALYKYGIDITNASLSQYALAYGISKSVSEMTQAEKAQLRFLAILDQSKNSWGDLSRTINEKVA